MLGKTHIFVGVASALVLTAPDNLSGCLCAIVGGAVGGCISDIDVSSNKNSRDSLYAKLISTGLIPLALIVDFIFKGGIIDYVKNCKRATLVTGVVLFLALCFIGSKQDHRGFTHSLLALVLFSVAIGMFCKPLLIPFIIGFISHLVIDSLNKKPIKLFFPLEKGVCFKLCYSNKTVDKVCLAVGVVVTVLYLSLTLAVKINAGLP